MIKKHVTCSIVFLAYSGEHLLSMAVLTSVSKVDTILIHFV